MSQGTHTLTDSFLLSTLTNGWERIWLNRNVDGDREYRISPGTRWCAKGARVSVGEGATIGVASRVHDFVVIGAGVAIGARCVLETNVTIGNYSRVGDDTLIKRGARIGQDTTLVGKNIVGEGARIGAICKIGENAHIAGAIWNAVTIGRLSHVRGGQVMHGNRIGEGCECFEALIYPNCTIGNGVRIDLGSLIHEGAVIRDDVTIGTHVIVDVDEVIASNTIVPNFARLGDAVIDDDTSAQTPST